MNGSRQIDSLLERAEVQRRLGNHHNATELARQALSLDPDHAQAHAVLALILLDARLLPAAGIEVRIALTLDGNDLFVHRAAAAVCFAERKLSDAWAHCLIALDGPSATPATYVLAARIRTAQGDRDQAYELLQSALELTPEDCGVWTALARHALDAGDHGEAARAIERALEADPLDRHAHITAGFIDLARGNPTSAESHARYALGQRATDPVALELLAAIQAHRSPLLGAWWRWNLWVWRRSEGQRIAVLVGSFVVVRLLLILLDALDYDEVAHIVQRLWFGLCVYTWVGPAIFRRMLARYLESVRLDPDF